VTNLKSLVLGCFTLKQTLQEKHADLPTNDQGVKISHEIADHMWSNIGCLTQLEELTVSDCGEFLTQ
jgi:hypothetical protein